MVGRAGEHGVAARNAQPGSTRSGFTFDAGSGSNGGGADRSRKLAG
ncbi:MAG: hypothetical protein ACJ8FC_06530 [Sphingomicrobium sp.]